MTDDLDTVEPAYVQDTIRDFKLANPRIEPGDSFRLGDQTFVAVKRHIWKKRGSKSYTFGITFAAQCVMCDARYETTVDSRFKAVTRTCETHRGQYRPRRGRATHITSNRPAPAQASVHGALQILRSSGREATVEAVVALAASRLPAPLQGRDTRKQQVQRALATLGASGRLDGVVQDGVIVPLEPRGVTAAQMFYVMPDEERSAWRQRGQDAVSVLIDAGELLGTSVPQEVAEQFVAARLVASGLDGSLAAHVAAGALNIAARSRRLRKQGGEIFFDEGEHIA
jgi:hypothetical protein